MKKENILLYASSEKDANMLYLTGVFVPDPFLAFSIHSKKIAIVHSLEYSRLLKRSNFDTLFLYEDCIQEAQKLFSHTSIQLSHLVLLIAKKYKVKSFTIPSNFPAGLALELIKSPLKIKISDTIFPERLLKNKQAIQSLKKASQASSAGMQAAEYVLKNSLIKKGKLYYNDTILTSERLRSHIEKACIDAGSIAQHTIVAGGNQACDPHECGFGPLKSNELIIVDIFPRSNATGYYGDMTRTFLKGKATIAQKKLVHTVLNAQKKALSLLKPDVNAKDIHQSVQSFFMQEGYYTQKKGETYSGFFHSTGHGLGLDLHEAPSIGSKETILKTGMVITIEPGLYYPNIGGVRIEDVAQITLDSYQKLSRFHYHWELDA